jgi:hypothetical protein
MDPHELLHLGVSRGIISAEQRAQLQTLLGAVEASETPPAETRGFTGIAIAYLIGAIVVLFAFGWFMVDRWKVLGDGGVFALAVTYGAIFLLVAQVMKREGFPVARGVATLLAVGMTPIAMWALLRWTGLWSLELQTMCARQEHPFTACQAQPMAIELAVVAAALAAMRQMAFAPFMIPIAVVGITLPERLLRELSPGPVIDGAAMGWRWMIIASVLAAVSYTMDRRRPRVDYALWLWCAAAAAMWFGGIMLFQADHALRWYLAPTSLLVVTASVMLRRMALLVVGMFGVFGFLAWLAFDVFKVTTAFPLVLALIGVSIIILTVWLQKRFPAAIRRMGGDPTQPPRIPGGVWTLLAPALLGVLLTSDAARLDQEEARDRRSRARAISASRQRAKRDAEAKTRSAAPPAPTTRPPSGKAP